MFTVLTFCHLHSKAACISFSVAVNRVAHGVGIIRNLSSRCLVLFYLSSGTSSSGSDRGRRTKHEVYIRGSIRSIVGPGSLEPQPQPQPQAAFAEALMRIGHRTGPDGRKVASLLRTGPKGHKRIH